MEVALKEALQRIEVSWSGSLYTIGLSSGAYTELSPFIEDLLYVVEWHLEKLLSELKNIVRNLLNTYTSKFTDILRARIDSVLGTHLSLDIERVGIDLIEQTLYFRFNSSLYVNVATDEDPDQVIKRLLREGLIDNRVIQMPMKS